MKPSEINSSRAFLVTLLGLTLLGVGALPALAATDACPLRTDLRLPDSSNSGAWNGELLTFVDVLDDELVVYSADRGYRGSIRLSEVPALAPFQPTTVEAIDGQLLVQLNQGRFAVLNSGFHPSALRRFTRSQAEAKKDEGSAGQLQAIYSWDLAGGDLIFCGDVQRGQAWPTGYLRAPLANPQDFQFLHGLERSINDPELIYCRIGYDYIATLGTDAYVMVGSKDGKATEIHRFRKGAAIADILEATFPPRPELEEFTEEQSFPRTMNVVIPSAHMPAGLYAWNGQLYVLTRRPEDGGTVWELHQVDPKSGKIQGSARLPGSANHLTVVPGPTWATLEKGAVRGFEDYESTGLRFIPGSAIKRIGEMDGQLLCTE